MKFLEDLLEEVQKLDLNATNAGLVAAGLISTYFLYKATYGSNNDRDALSILRGPKPSSFMKGNLDEVYNPSPESLEEWLDEYGTIYKIKTVFGKDGLVLADPKALAVIFGKPMQWSKTTDRTRGLLTLIGPGLFAMEGEDHRRQRKVMQPAFSMQQIRYAVETTMMDKVSQLKDIWAKKIQQGPKVIDVHTELSHMAMDIVGDAGFGYQFDTLHTDADELAKAFEDIIKTTTATDPIRLLGYFFPVVAKLPLKRNQVIPRSREIMNRIGTKIVADKKKELEAQKEHMDDLFGKDLLSVILKSNMAESANQRLSDEEVVAQIATFITGGHDTSASATTWALYAMAANPHMQDKLRAECRSVSADHPTYDELNSLEYLDQVVKEVLRLYTPVTKTVRQPVGDEVVPLSEPIVDKYGKVHHEIFIKGGTNITVWNASLLWAKRYWGEDAHDFRPERHANPPKTAEGIPSVVGHLVSFNSGTRACIAWRFAMAEIKTLLFIMMRNFVFEIDPKLVIKRRSVLSVQPAVVGDEKGVPLPLKLSIYKPSS